jgi:triosephosphate isomerase
MNASFESTSALLDGLASQWSGVHNAEVAVCPPFPYLARAAELLEQSNIGFGAQDLSEHEAGAYTGQVSAEMLIDLGCKYVLVGHSERREYQKESSELVAAKFDAAIAKGLMPILCVGETLSEREQDQTFDVIGRQLRAVIDRCGLSGVAKGVVAYEPVWAIGTGKSATPEMAQEVHAYIREVLGPEGEHTAILYGGSVKPESAAALFGQQDIDGALVGGASLKVDDFLAICRAAE